MVTIAAEVGMLAWLRRNYRFLTRRWPPPVALAAFITLLVSQPGFGSRAPTFPFTIEGDRFYLNGSPVFLNMIAYQPLEPGETVADEIRTARIQDDLRRFQGFRGGSDPILLRVYAQPTTQFPIRMPKAFYDGIRELDFWIVRDIYFDSNFLAPDAVAKGHAAIDAMMAEVAAAGAFDRIFSWEIGNEFQAGGLEEAALESFLAAMRNYIKVRMAEPGRENFSNWVTWASWPPSDPLRTAGNPISVPSLDYESYNAYSYDPERIRDHQAGPVTGTPFEGYLAALKAVVPNKPVVISESGLPDSPSAEGDNDQSRLPPWYPVYRRGGLTQEQAGEGIADRYWDARLSGTVAGFCAFEWSDEWWKSGDPAVQSGPEEFFGLARFVTSPTTQLRFKLQQEVLRSLYTMRLPNAVPLLTGVAADSTLLSPTGTTTVHALLAPGAAPVRYRWESSRGRIVGDSDTVQFHAGGRALGPAQVTVVAIDEAGRASQASLTITIQSSAPSVEITTFGATRSSGRVANVDLTQYKAVLYIETNQYYVQPFTDMTSIWVGTDGHWWSTNFATFSDLPRLHAWVVPASFDPPATMGGPPAGFIAEAVRDTENDTDNDLLPDDFEPSPPPPQDRYDDPDADKSNNLEELLNGTNPSLPDNDSDTDGLPDTWERRYFGTLAYGPTDDPDGDELSNATELDIETHPGRRNIDGDQDGLPDAWEIRRFGTVDHCGASVTCLDAYELGGPFTDDPLTVAATPIRAAHVTELRERVNSLRARFGLTASLWTDPALPGVVVKAAHIDELRSRLQDVYSSAGRTPPFFTDPILTPGQTIIKAVHIAELRTAVLAIE